MLAVFESRSVGVFYARFTEVRFTDRSSAGLGTNDEIRSPSSYITSAKTLLLKWLRVAGNRFQWLFNGFSMAVDGLSAKCTTN